MELYINDLYESMSNEIKVIHNQNDRTLTKLELIIPLIQKKLIELKEFLLSFENLTSDKEINFFKYIKPKFNSQLIFNIELYNFEIQTPSFSKELKTEYIKNQILKLKKLITENIDFYRYFKSNATYFDSIYFSRYNNDFRTRLNNLCFESDPRFSTSHDYLLAQFQAYEMLINHFENLISEDTIRDENKTMISKYENKLTWTSSKSNLIELIYAFQQTGCFNNGNADIKQIASFFSEIFQTNLGDIYRTYIDLRARNSRTKFLDTLKNNLENKMLEDDF
jgi:hypothetical protein